MSTPKEQLKKIFETSTELSEAACDLMLQALGGAIKIKQGPILWALMDTEGSPATISGLKLFVYLQYYFCATVYREDKSTVTRPLSDCDLAYLVAAAAFGLQEGCNKFDDAYAAGDLSTIHSLQINEKQFLKFFYSPETPFNMATVVSHTQQIRSFWNAHPSAFVGFITPELTAYILKLQGAGSFVIRFNSSGGISAVVIDAASAIQSHPLDASMMATPLSLIALIQRSTTLQSFAQISESTSLPKATVLPSLKSSASVDEAAVEAEITRQKGGANPEASSAPNAAAPTTTFTTTAASGSTGRNFVVTTAPAFTKQSSATGATAFGAIEAVKEAPKKSPSAQTKPEEASDDKNKKRKKEAVDGRKKAVKKSKKQEEDEDEDGSDDEDENGSDEDGDGDDDGDNGEGGSDDEDHDSEEDEEDEDYNDEEDDEDDDISEGEDE